MEVIKQIITDASPKSCDLDPAPTWLVVESVDELLPMLSLKNHYNIVAVIHCSRQIQDWLHIAIDKEAWIKQ